MNPLRIRVSWESGQCFVAKAVHEGRKMRATSECGAEAAAHNLALRAFYGGNTKEFRERATALRVDPVGQGECCRTFDAYVQP
jgi:hypothetical protein